jgi:diguanylate cyclase (GGDEF)-like protein
VVNRAIEWLGRQPTRRLIAAALALLAVIATIDVGTKPDVSFCVFYVIPAFLTAAGDRRAGLVMTGVSDLVWLVADSVNRTYSGPLVPYWNAAARLAVLALIALLVSDLTGKLARESDLSRTDALTGLPNARAFHEATATEIYRMRRSGAVLTAAYVDIDNFKAVNDTLGHASGDELLNLVARTMSGILRGTDVVARLGGDEFALLLPGAGLDDAKGRLQAVHNALNSATAGTEPAVGFSIGAVTFTEPPHSSAHMIARADRVMYGVKQHGKNTVWAEEADAVATPGPAPAAGAAARRGRTAPE